jgi:hypothetical protein
LTPDFENDIQNQEVPTGAPMTRAPALLLALAACAASPDGSTDAGTGTGAGSGTVSVPTRYAFASRYDAAASSVAYDGQVFRWLLVKDLDAYLDSVAEGVTKGTLQAAAGTIVSALRFYYQFDATTAAGVPVRLATTPPLLFDRYDQYPSQPALAPKLAGNEKVGARKDWGTAAVGVGGVDVPEALLFKAFDDFEANALAIANGTFATGPDGKPLASPALAADGRHLQELVEKSLLGALAFSQAADKYLDDDLAGEGLLVEHVRDGTKPYTKLEHYWDEGFGYFGASRDLLDYTAEELAGLSGRGDYTGGAHDTDGDGRIDLRGEYNFPFAVYAARRDAQSKDGAKTSFARDAMQAFLEGRALIAATPEGPVPAETMAQIKAARDRAVSAWEASIAATVVSYLNRVVGHTRRLQGADPAYAFADHAKHWTEMKALSLAFQFNPRSRLSDGDFAALQARLGPFPVTDAAKLAQARTALLEARALLAERFGFAAANLGDENGEGGW